MIKVGIIGCGRIAREAHIPAYKVLQEVEVDCIADSSAKALEITRKLLKNVKTFQDYRDLLDTDVDMVNICTPPQTHPEICIEAAKKGKHILVEKPLATSLTEAKMIEQTVENTGVKLCVTHNWRYMSSLQSIKERIEKGELGQILTINITVNATTPDITNLRRFGVDSLLDGGIHAIDIMGWLGGEPEQVFAIPYHMFKEFPETTGVRAFVVFRGGVVCSLEHLCFSGCIEWSVEVHGTGASMKADIWRDNVSFISGGPPLPPFETWKSIKNSWRFLWDVVRGGLSKRKYRSHRAIIQCFLKSLDENAEPPIEIQDAIKSLRIYEGIKKSMKTNTVVTI